MTGGSLAAVERMLARIAACDVTLAGRCAAALAPVTAAIQATAWPEMATCFSRLTATGYPVEFAWSAHDPSVRWTAEAGAPEMAEARRLPRIADAIPGADAATLAALQRGHRLRWGAWIGGRHGHAGDATKIYAELPGIAPEGWVPRGWPAGLAWRMAGMHPDGRRELYARGVALDRTALVRVDRMLLGGDGALAAAVCGFVGDDEPPRPAGLSVAIDADGSVQALTWFVIAKALFRNDAAARARLLRVDADPAARVLYAALSDGADDGRWRHGMIGIGIDRTGRRWVQAGLRPT